MMRYKTAKSSCVHSRGLTCFQIVAQEMVASQPKTSTADVTVHIKDANDNFPVFREDSYRSVIPENAPAGTVVAVVRVSALLRSEQGSS